MSEKEFFNLSREDFLAAAADHIFLPPRDLNVPTFIHHRHITTMEPPGAVTRISCRLWIVIITSHHIVAAIAKLAMLTAWQCAASNWIDNLLFLVRQHFTDRAATQLDGIIDLGHVANRGSLGH